MERRRGVNVVNLHGSSISSTDLQPNENSSSEPIVFRDVDIGSCRTLWNSSYLQERLGDKPVQVHVSSQKQLDFLHKNFLYRSLSFREYLTRITQPQGQPLQEYFIDPHEYYYLRCLGEDIRKDKADISKQFPSIASDLKFPDVCPPEKFFSSVLRIASPGTQLWTHYDVMDNILIQISGRKTAILYPPSDAPHLYLCGDKSKILDPDHVDLQEYPLYANTTRYDAQLIPGDVLFIPALWFHNMTALDLSIAVNMFWKGLDDGFYDSKDVYGNKDLVPAQRAQQGLQKAMTTLAELPRVYKEFYTHKLMARLQSSLDQEET